MIDGISFSGFRLHASNSLRRYHRHFRSYIHILFSDIRHINNPNATKKFSSWWLFPAPGARYNPIIDQHTFRPSESVYQRGGKETRAWLGLAWNTIIS